MLLYTPTSQSATSKLTAPPNHLGDIVLNNQAARISLALCRHVPELVQVLQLLKVICQIGVPRPYRNVLRCIARLDGHGLLPVNSLNLAFEWTL